MCLHGGSRKKPKWCPAQETQRGVGQEWKHVKEDCNKLKDEDQHLQTKYFTESDPHQ